MYEAAFGIVGIVVGAIGVFLYLQASGKSMVAKAKVEADQLRENALREAQNKAK